VRNKIIRTEINGRQYQAAVTPDRRVVSLHRLVPRSVLVGEQWVTDYEYRSISPNDSRRTAIESAVLACVP
jgi:hypothetical protein